jgi:hypothetical protein
VDIENESHEIARSLETIVAMTHRKRLVFRGKQKRERALAQLDAFVFGLHRPGHRGGRRADAALAVSKKPRL